MPSSAEIVRSAFETFNEEGSEALIRFVHPEAELTTPPELSPEPDTYRGHEGARRYWASFYEVMEEIEVYPHTLHDWGDGIVVAEMLLRARGRATGLAAEQRATMVITLADRKVYKVTFHRRLEEAEQEAARRGGARPAQIGSSHGEARSA